MNIDFVLDWFRRFYLGDAVIDFMIDDSNPSMVYWGFAPSGAKTADATWCIVRTKKGANGLTGIRVADGMRGTDGKVKLNKIFDNRATYNYIEP